MTTDSAPWRRRSRMALVMPASLLKISAQRLKGLFVVRTMEPRS